jgi:hypothetical protein
MAWMERHGPHYRVRYRYASQVILDGTYDTADAAHDRVSRLGHLNGPRSGGSPHRRRRWPTGSPRGCPPTSPALRPACDGHAKRGWQPLIPGFRFHDLRHTHRTWMDEDGIAEALKCQRLGHQLPGIRGVYAHATEPHAGPPPGRPPRALARQWRPLVKTSRPTAGTAGVGSQDVRDRSVSGRA